MIYKEEIRDLFTCPPDYYLAHCISADFALGAGIAVEFNRRFNMRNHLNESYPGYRAWFHKNYILGDCILLGPVLNLVTKERYFHKPTLKSMAHALMAMKRICIEKSIHKIAMPMIGAGLDRLLWIDVSSLIQTVFGDLQDMEICVCRKF